MSKKLIAVALGVMVFAMVFASAAGLGGTTVGQVGAEADIVAACDTTGVNVDFTTAWDGTAGEFVVTEVVLTNLGDTTANECNGHSATVSVSTFDAITGGYTDIGTASIDPIDGSAADVPLVPAVNAEAVDHIAIIITKPAP